MKVLLFLCFCFMIGLAEAQHLDFDHTVVLPDSCKFKKITPEQMTDTINMNQNGTDQWEYILFENSSENEISIDEYFKSVRTIFELILKFDDILMDICVMTNKENHVTCIKGFYYCFDKETKEVGVIYPRFK